MYKEEGQNLKAQCFDEVCPNCMHTVCNSL